MRSGRDWTLAWRGAGIRPNSSTAQGWGDASLGSAPCRLLQGHACLLREPQDPSLLRMHGKGCFPLP